MEKISQVGQELRRKSKLKEQQLQTEFKESLDRLEKNLTELSSNSLTQIESDITKNYNEWTEKLARANHKSFKNKINEVKENWTEELTAWRKMILIFLPTSLIFGLMLGIFATLYFSPSAELKVKASDIVKAEDGTQYLQTSKIPNLVIDKVEIK